MSRTGPTIIIADLDGGNTVTLTGASAPYPVPRIKYPYEVETSINRSGTDGAGLRVLVINGNDPSWGDLELPVAYLTSDMVSKMDTRYAARSAFKVTLNGGSTWYRCAFQKDGWDPQNWTQDYTKQGGTIKLHVIGVIS